MEAIVTVDHGLTLAILQDKVIHETAMRHRHLGLPEIKDRSLSHQGQFSLILLGQEGILKDHSHLA